MRNYYDDLEVSKTASKEVIEKAYKVLAKKYHPDATQEEDKQTAEEKFKRISEAYETLFDDEKRKNYDIALEKSNPSISYEEYLSVVQERNALNHSLNDVENAYNQFKNKVMMNQYSYKNTYQNTHYQPSSRNNVYQFAHPNNNTAPSKRKTYDDVNAGKPASAFDYFKYHIKELFSNISFILIRVLIFVLVVSFFLSTNIFRLFIK